MLKYSDITTKLGYNTNSFKDLVLKAKDSEGYAFDVTNSGRLIKGKTPYWNIWSNISPTNWLLTQNQMQCAVDSSVKFSELGDSYNHYAQAPYLEVPEKMYYLTHLDYSGTFYNPEFQFPAGINKYRGFIKGKNNSYYAESALTDISSRSDWSLTLYNPQEGDYYFGVKVYNDSEYEVPLLRSNVEIHKLPSMKQVTTICEIAYSEGFTYMNSCSGDIMVQSTQYSNTIRYRWSYAKYISGVLTPVSGLNAPIQETTFNVGDLNHYKFVEYTFPQPIRISDIPTDYYLIIELVSSTTANSFEEIPQLIHQL